MKRLLSILLLLLYLLPAEGQLIFGKFKDPGPQHNDTLSSPSEPGIRIGLIKETLFEVAEPATWDYWSTYCSQGAITGLGGNITRVSQAGAPSGGYVAQVSLAKNDPYCAGDVNRAELQDIQFAGQPWGTKTWFACAIKIPDSSFAYDESPEEIINVHQSGQTGSNPFGIRTRAGHLWVTKTYSEGGNPGFDIDVFDIGAITYNEWFSLVIYTEWGGNATGVTKVWINDVLVFDPQSNIPKAGIPRVNAYINQGMTWKWGMYKWSWAQNYPGANLSIVRKAIFFDSVRFGGEYSDYNSVKPF